MNFARAYRLDEYVADNPQVWQSLNSIRQGNHLDFCLLPAFPEKWEVELIVDLGDQFAVDGAEVDLGNRLAGLREGYWPTFGWYVARRAGRGGFPYQPPSFDTVQVHPEEDGLDRPNVIHLRFFDLDMRPGEAEVRPTAEPALTLMDTYSHMISSMQRQAADKLEAALGTT